MPRATQVFVPNDLPTHTYVRRATQNLEQRLKQAFEIPKMVVSISGPSKSGKTVLVTKIVAPENLILIPGATIRSENDLWQHALQWMNAPTSRTETKNSSKKISAEVSAGGKVGLPFVAEGKADGKGSLGHETGASVSQSFVSEGIQQVIKEISNSSFVLFVDDFHYISKPIQLEIGKQIKAAAEAGVRICTASVHHRNDDVVRSNPELRGRVTAIDSDYWERNELEAIANLGFRKLNMDVSPRVVSQLAVEAFGSPQLMQAICLNFCFETGVSETLPSQKRVEADFVTLRNVFERTSTFCNFSTMINQLHTGPRQRGVDRKEYTFSDGTKGDVYRCVLLAMKANPPKLSLKYDELLERTATACSGKVKPSGSSVNQALIQMNSIAKLVQDAPVLEWDEDVLDIIEPYFLFFLRRSTYLKNIAADNDDKRKSTDGNSDDFYITPL